MKLIKIYQFENRRERAEKEVYLGVVNFEADLAGLLDADVVGLGRLVLQIEPLFQIVTS